jgi:predicted aldo/keto reductase-like oxidoreductase
VEPTFTALEEAVELCRGAFLEDVSVTDSQAFGEWLLITREQMGCLTLEALRRLAEGSELGTYVCRLCDKCLPCPEAIDIPRLFELEGVYDRQMWDAVVRDPGDFALRSRLRFWFENQERARAAYTAVTVKADACTNCGDCEPRCPYRLPIVRKLRHTHYKLTGMPVLY